ncbi:D-alanyl-D-alanine carboxypeptidase family protein [Anaerococcus sp. Marseille-P3625]|uniref:D-alanyl-D-alanine carboxypeptidase family protein n=1 Tax=Anaerococcus sp. Marseille-P3625 TaxID=1977277 RepID=UPI000C08D1F6|nr:serine hydrolase [Anaerococcus sp. Marseille-P3625]
MKKKSLAIFILPLAIIILLIIWRNQENKNKLGKFNSKALYVYNLTDDKEVLAVNENEKLPMASLTKMMTVLVSLEKIPDISAKTTVDTQSYQKLIDENASMAGFYGGEEVSYRDLLYGAMLPSGGEAADSLAVNISGSILQFTGLMNDKAKDLGLTNTHFQNADGMDEPGHYSSAKDMAMLLKEALKNGDFRAIFTKKDFTSSQSPDHPMGVYMQSTVFKKLENYEQNGFEIIGGKSGTTEKAGLCWISLAYKNGCEYIVVTMGAPYTDINNTGDGQIKDTLSILEDL